MTPRRTHQRGNRSSSTPIADRTREATVAAREFQNDARNNTTRRCNDGCQSELDLHTLPQMRHGSLIAALVAALVVLSATAGTSAGGSLVKVTSGRWDGRVWTFAASDQVSGVSISYCWKMSFATGRGGSGGCSQYINQANSPLLPFYGMDIGEAIGRCPGLDYVAGPVVASASSVQITLSTRGVIHTSTVAAPAGLAGSIRFFTAKIPCGTQAVTATARDRAGKVVARYS